MIGRLDRWVGKHLFIPVIVRVCQRARITQYTFANHAKMIASLALVARGPKDIGTWIFVLLVIIAAVDVAISAVIPDYRAGGSGFWRKFSLVFFPLSVVANPTALLRHLFWVAALFSEYALTIDTIPPAEVKEPRRKLAKVRA